MAFASWLNISVADTRSALVYRVWKAVADLLAGDMAGKWTVVNTSAGASPGWTSDSSPGDGGWVVIQNETANADSTKAQVFVGCRTSSGALAGFGTKAAGLWVACSPIGGWDAAGYFGSSLADWRNSSLQTQAGSASASTMLLILSSGDSVNHRPGGFWLYFRTGTGVQSGFACRHLIPCTGGAVARTRYSYSWATWAANDSGGYYNASRNGVAKTSMDGWDTAGFGHNGGTSDLIAMGQDAEDSTWVLVPLICTDVTLGKTRGYTEFPSRCGAGDGDLNGSAGTATLWVWGGMAWPREPSRDGTWI